MAKSFFLLKCETGLPFRLTDLHEKYKKQVQTRIYNGNLKQP